MSTGWVLNPADGRAAADPADPLAVSRDLLDRARAAPGPDTATEVREAAARLRPVDPTTIDADPARIAFWLNLYNAMLLQRLGERPIRGSVLLHLRLFSKLAYEVGGLTYTPNVIEHALLRGNRRPPYRMRPLLRSSDPRLAAAPEAPDARIHFALNCGARSCPPIRGYSAEGLDAELELATRSYLEAETSIDPDRGRVRLPRLMRLYRADFGDARAQLEFVAARLDGVGEMVRSGAPLKIGHGRFDWAPAPRMTSPPG
jgi:hypothetical protein